MMKLHHFGKPLQWGILRHVLLEWQRCFRDEYDFLSQYLFPTDDLAKCYPGKDVPWDDGYRIVTHKDGTIVGVDDEDNTNRLLLTKPDIILYRFDLKRFRHETCGCLGLTSSTDEIRPLDRAIPWGVWEPEKGIAFPVTLLMYSFQEKFKESVLERIINRQGPGEIILTPTRNHWMGGIDELARKHKMLFVSLDEIIQMEDGKLLPTPEWDEYLTTFCKMVEMDLPSRSQHNMPEIPPFEFRKKGDMWVIRFDGEETYLKDSVGLQCIGHLLAKPHDPIFVMELRAILNGPKPDAVAMPLAREAIVDQATLTDLKHRYLELQSDLETALRDGNEIMEVETEREMEKIIQYLGQVKAIGGETRKVNDDFEKARSATSKAFWRSVNQIRGDLPLLATHLEKSCVVGMVCNYAPERSINWIL